MPQADMDRFSETLERAREAFWVAVTDGYPMVKTGDLTPEQRLAFDDATRATLAAWVRNNHPEKFYRVSLYVRTGEDFDVTDLVGMTSRDPFFTRVTVMHDSEEMPRGVWEATVEHLSGGIDPTR